jgi:hypothetical protein
MSKKQSERETREMNAYPKYIEAIKKATKLIKKIKYKR